MSGAKRRPQIPGRRDGDAGEAIAGLAARKAAARLLAAVIDARTPLDGLTDNEHGHPQYKALGSVASVPDAVLGTVRMPNVQFRFSNQPAQQGRLP